METVELGFIPDAAQWAQRQWSGVNVHDVRLRRRAVELGTQMALLPGGSLPQQMKSRAQLKAAYRLLNNAKVSHERISEPHWHATRERAAAEPVVLLVQDVTHLNYTRYANAMQGLGPIGSGEEQGLLLHTTLAVYWKIISKKMDQ